MPFYKERMSSKYVSELINKLRPAYQPVQEKTFFDIAGRGHYENPLSDLLAFFLNPRQEHGFGSMYMNALLSALHIEPSDSYLKQDPLREASTESNNRLDLILETASLVIAIEVKVFHDAVNPFADYETHIAKYYKTDSRFVLFAPKTLSAPGNWQMLTFDTLAASIRQHTELAPGNKWKVLSDELCLHLENYSKGTPIMEPDYRKQLDQHYFDMCKIEQLKKDYLEALQLHVYHQLHEKLGCEIEHKTGQWDLQQYGSILEFWPKKWPSVVLILCPRTHSTNSAGFLLRCPPDTSESIQTAITEGLGFSKQSGHKDCNWCNYECESIGDAIDGLLKAAEVYKDVLTE